MIHTYRCLGILLIFLFPAVLITELHAQDIPMKKYSVKDGLPSGTIYSMLADSRGFLWFGTDAGVSRFDGHKFVNYTLSDGLAENEVLKVAEDSKGRIWMLGLSGNLSYYYKDKFYNPDNDSVLRKARINHTYIFFFEDQRHRLWFTSFTGYTLIDGNKVKFFDHDACKIYADGIVMNHTGGGVVIMAPEVKLSNNSGAGLFIYKNDQFEKVTSLYTNLQRARYFRMPDGGTLMVTREGIVWQKDTDQRLILPLPEGMTASSILGLFVSSDGLMWLETVNNGVLCYEYRQLQQPPKMYLENRGIADVTEDREHNIWIATFGEGVFMLPASYKGVRNYYSANYDKHIVYCVTKDRVGNIYTGHDDLTVNVLKGGKTTRLFFENQQKNVGFNRVGRLLMDGDNMWVGTDVDLTRITVHNSFNTINVVKHQRGPGMAVSNIFAVKDLSKYNNDVLVCNSNSVLHHDSARYKGDTLTVLSSTGKRYYCVFSDKKGVIWYGASDGLHSISGKAEKNYGDSNKYLAGNIYAIRETEDSMLVVASYGYGIMLCKEGRIIQHITDKDGLSSNLCKRLFIKGNEIFAATAGGVSKLFYSHGHVDSVKIYTTENGLISNNVNDIYADDSELCIATPEGLTVMNIGMAETKAEAPPVYITAIKNNTHFLQPDSSYTFGYNHNSIQFVYSAISYRVPGDVQYQYRLNDDQLWMTTKNTSIDFPSLPAGSYKFQLRARILNGPWSDTRSFSFTINEPFWKTWWFLALCALLFTGLAVYISQRRAAMQRQKIAEELKIKDQVAYLEQQALQAMMNPHFIFNVMNSIQHFINNNESHEANLYLTDFAKLIRMNLDISSKRYIPLDEEVAYLELYMALESVRFGKLLTYNIEVDEDIDGDETMVPVMLLQPFIENAIWHGILPKNEAGHVQVDIRKAPGNMLKVTITDNGVGVPENKEAKALAIKAHISRGMKMTRQRLDLLSRISGHELYIRIEDAFPGAEYRGTRVELLLPGDLA